MGMEDFTPSMEPTIPESTSEKVEKLLPNERKFVEIEAQIIEATVMLKAKIDQENWKSFGDAQVSLSKRNAEQLIGKSHNHFSKEDDKRGSELRELSEALVVSRIAEKVKEGIYDINDLPEGRGREEVETLIGAEDS